MGKVLVPRTDGDHEIGIVRAHLEEDAAKTAIHRRADKPDRGRRLLARRLQPWRHAARRDRDRPGRPFVGRRAPLPAAAAANDRRARDLGRGNGEGDPARRRQRVRAPGRLVRAAYPLRAEEHELVPLRRRRGSTPRWRVRSRSTRRAARSSRWPGAATGTLTARRSKEERTTTATSRSPTSCRSSRRRARRAAAGRGAGEPGRADPPAGGRRRARSCRRARHGRPRRALAGDGGGRCRARGGEP